uniref:Retrotransposon protein, putative, Ty1-copia subclass n=1 Tax=Tanacetum cinerariifolium TaxID=118510 RepID=A0A699IVB6_TANCI|nr:retrotransposon protein, putative, Ty1-copia subclass [Tanacetum cinerariifolium]
MCLYIDAEEHELGDLGEPTNYKAAFLDPEFEKWLNAMNVEMQSMKDNEVWVLVELHHNGIDYEETFSPVADIRAIRILIAIAAYYDYEIWQMDVKTTFLNGYLNEEVYMEQPKGFVNPKYPNRLCKLKRSIYGLKQASRQWNKRFDDEIKNIPMLQSVKTYLGKYFSMKDLGEAAYILLIKIYIDRSKQLIGLCQSAYIKKTLKQYCMENSKRGSIPMQEKLKLSKSQGASTPAEMKHMQNVPYASAVGAIAIANESGITKGPRYFSAKVHYLREVIELGDIKREKVHTYDNLADPFTKALAFSKHFEHTRNIGMLPTNRTMKNTELFVNVVALAILVITVVANICIQMTTCVIFVFWIEHAFIMLLMLILLAIVCSLSLAIPTTKYYLDIKYGNKLKLTNIECSRKKHLSVAEGLRVDLEKYWILAYSSGPQFVIGRSAPYTASGVFCLLNTLILVETDRCGKVLDKEATSVANEAIRLKHLWSAWQKVSSQSKVSNL